MAQFVTQIFGLQILKMWLGCAMAAPVFWIWAKRLRTQTLGQVEQIWAEAQDKTTGEPCEGPSLVEDWRSLQQQRSDAPSSSLLWKFKQWQGIHSVILVTSANCLLGLAQLPQIDYMVDHQWPILPPVVYLLLQGLCLVPWVGLLVGCSWLYFPVVARLGQVKWSRQEYKSAVFWELASLFCIWLGCCSALCSLPRVMPMLAVMSLGFMGSVLCSGQASTKVAESPSPLLPGELRDRIVEIGQRAGITVQTVNILPKMRSSMANAFAHTDGSVTLTDYLIAHSRRSEIDAIVGHEIAHVKSHHASRKLGINFLLFGTLLWSLLNLQWGITLLVVFILCWLPFYLSRRFEYEADAISGQLIQQPAQMIASLARLEQLNPLRQPGNKETTHPTMLKRFEAIAKAHNLSDETVRQQLLQAAEPIDPSEAYPIPLGTDDKIFPTSEKQKYQQRELFLLLAASVVPLAAIAALSPYLPSRNLQIALAGAGLLVVLGACYWSDRHGNLPKPVLQRLRQQLSQPPGPSAIVSLAPDGRPHTYGGSWFWDLGVLSLEEGQLHYRGGQTEFCLSPDQVNNLRLAADVPSLVRTPNLYFTWNNAEEGSHGDLRLRFVDLPSETTIRQVTRDWRDRLETWRQTSASQPSQAKRLNRDCFVTAMAAPRTYRQLCNNLFWLWLLGAMGALMLVGLLELTPASWFYVSGGPVLVAAYTLLCYLIAPQRSSSAQLIRQTQT